MSEQAQDTSQPRSAYTTIPITMFEPSKDEPNIEYRQDRMRVLLSAVLVVILISAITFIAWGVEPNLPNAVSESRISKQIQDGSLTRTKSSDTQLPSSEIQKESKFYSDAPQNFYNSLDITGLSPAVRACYTIRSTLSSTVIAGAFGIALGFAYFFGTFLYRKFQTSISVERKMFFGAIHDQMISRTVPATANELAEVLGGFTEYEKLVLERRNMYWGLFLRAALALLVVTFISILIATCKIESQAGLPIITGIIAFIIGQGTDVGQSIGRPLVVAPVRASNNNQNDVPEYPPNTKVSSEKSSKPSSPGSSETSSDQAIKGRDELSR